MNNTTHIITFDFPSEKSNLQSPLKHFNSKIHSYGGKVIDEEVRGRECTAIFEMAEKNFNEFLFILSTFNNCKVLK